MIGKHVLGSFRISRWLLPFIPPSILLVLLMLRYLVNAIIVVVDSMAFIVAKGNFCLAILNSEAQFLILAVVILQHGLTVDKKL